MSDDVDYRYAYTDDWICEPQSPAMHKGEVTIFEDPVSTPLVKYCHVLLVSFSGLAAIWNPS